MADPKLFVFSRNIGNARYSFNVPCSSWIEAQKFAASNLWRLDGEHMMTLPAWLPNWAADILTIWKNRGKEHG